MAHLTLTNPVFATYAVAASLMIIKVASMSWLTVARMIRENGGFRNPEDLAQTPMNKHPHPQQLAPNEAVERVRRIHQNDLENIPFFLVAGLLYVLTDPSLVLARVLFYGYVVSRLETFRGPGRIRSRPTKRPWFKTTIAGRNGNVEGWGTVFDPVQPNVYGFK